MWQYLSTLRHRIRRPPLGSNFNVERSIRHSVGPLEFLASRMTSSVIAGERADTMLELGKLLEGIDVR